MDIMEVRLLYLIMSQRINFTQMERFGNHGEQTYRNLFSRKLDWLRFNCYLAIHYFSEYRRKKAIAVDPSYISKSGKHTHGVGGTSGPVRREERNMVSKYWASALLKRKLIKVGICWQLRRPVPQN